MNTRLLLSGSVLVRISLTLYKYVPRDMCNVRGTYYIRILIYAQQLKKNEKTWYNNGWSVVKSLHCLSLYWALGCLFSWYMLATCLSDVLRQPDIHLVFLIIRRVLILFWCNYLYNINPPLCSYCAKVVYLSFNWIYQGSILITTMAREGDS